MIEVLNSFWALEFGGTLLKGMGFFLGSGFQDVDRQTDIVAFIYTITLNWCHQNHSSLDKNEKFKHQLNVPMSLRRYSLCLIQKGVRATFAIGLLQGKILRHNLV